ncbi:MAG: DUF1461 domain-containing protein [Dehalococcoidales bacterium]|nr:DUF1461 domain-containing protein [Dehalococcoidales bacterium]
MFSLYDDYRSMSLTVYNLSMKILAFIARVFFIVSLPLFAFTAGITTAANTRSFYTVRFERYDVKQSLADNGLTVTDHQLQDIATGFIRYFRSGEEYIQLTVLQNGQPVPVFNEEEQIHFKDVKGLVVLNYRVLGFTLLYCLLYAVTAVWWPKGKRRVSLAKDLVVGGGLTLGLMLIMGIAFTINFNGMWLLFHELSFSNLFWSASGNMLLLFPEGFWVDAVRYCAIFTAATAAVLGAIGWGYIRMKRNQGIG